MSTLRQIIYNIRNVPDAGISNRAKTLSDRQIAFWVKNWRSRIMVDEFEKNPVIDPTWEQDLGCLDLKTVDKADCSKYKWGEDVKKVVIPELMKISTKRAGIIPSLTFVGLIDKVTTIPVDAYGYGELNNFVMYSPKKGIEAKIIGNTIYVFENKKDNLDIVDEDELCAINVRGIFDDPTIYTCWIIKDCCGSDGVVSCFDWDKDCYPIPGHLENVLYGAIWQREMGLVVNAKVDDRNNEKVDAGN